MRYIVVQPLFHVDVEDVAPCGQTSTACQAHGPVVGEAVAANGAILNALSAFLQQLAPLLLQLLPLFIKPAPSGELTATV